MKYLILLTAISFNSAAGTCEKFHELAKGVMMHRQAGTTIIELLKAVDGAKMTSQLAREAYSRPVMAYPENKKVAINEFANEVYLECLNLPEGKNAL